MERHNNGGRATTWSSSLTGFVAKGELSKPISVKTIDASKTVV